MAGRGGLNLTTASPCRPSSALPSGAEPDRGDPGLSARCPAALVRRTRPADLRRVERRVFPESFKARPCCGRGSPAWGITASRSAPPPPHRDRGWRPDLRHAGGRPHCAHHRDAARPRGASWPRLGSDGAWVPLLEGLGVPVAPLRPANAASPARGPTRSASAMPARRLKRIALTFAGETVPGEAIVTRTGLEGGRSTPCHAPCARDPRGGGGAVVVDLRRTSTSRRWRRGSRKGGRAIPSRPGCAGRRPVPRRHRPDAGGGGRRPAGRSGALARLIKAARSPSPA